MTLRSSLLMMTLFVSGGCGTESELEASFAREVLAVCADQNTADYHFPGRALFNATRGGDVLRQHYSDLLTAMNEPALSCGPTPVEAYRLLVGHTFSEDPLIIRAQKIGDQYQVATMRMRGNVGSLSIEDPLGTRKVDSQTWSRLARAVDDYGIWFRPAYRIERPIDPVYPDGSDFVFEVRRNNHYHAIVRGVGIEPEFDRVWRSLFDMARLDSRGADPHRTFRDGKTVLQTAEASPVESRAKIVALVRRFLYPVAPKLQYQ